MSRVFDSSQVGANLQTIITPSSAVYNNLQAWTMACWVNPTTDTGFSALITKDPQTSYGIQLNLEAGLKVQGFGNYTVATPTTTTNEAVSLNTWSHLAATFDNAGDRKVHIYINGIEATYSVQNAASGTIIDDSAHGWVFGSDTFSGDSLNGSIAEGAIYNTALTSGQVATLVASTVGATGSPVGYWHFCGFASPEPDSSGNGNDAVLSTNPPTQGSNSPGYSACTPPTPTLPYSVPDCRNYATFPNSSRTVNQTKIYDVQTSSNSAVPGTDSRAAGAPTDDRITPNIPENSRTPGTYGPGE
jgi:hypothetical protein